MTPTKTLQTVALFVLLALGSPVFADDTCLKYEPATSVVTGVIKRVTFPGRPNYESIKDGDEPERYWVIFLDKKTCVDGNPAQELDSVAVSEIKSMQLIVTGSDYKKYKKMVGKRVEVTGKLMQAISGHHHTDVLIQADNIKVPASVTASESPEAFIKRLYKEHMIDYVKNVYWFDNPRKMSPYFDKTLIDVFMRDEICKEITKEICADDSDPIINAQDYDEKYPYQLDVTRIGNKSPVRTKVVFRGGEENINGSKRVIYFTLRERANSWRITDIAYPSVNSLAKTILDYKPNFDSIDKFILYMERTTKSKENKESRIVKIVGKKCYVLFTLEEGMNYKQHLAALQIDDGYYVFIKEKIVGGRGIRSIESFRVGGSKVILETHEYGKNDPMCCPSVPGKMELNLHEKR